MTQKQFYKSMSWRRARRAYISYRQSLDGGICELCKEEPGLIVHHKIWLNDINCNDPDVSLSFDNLRYECQACHNKEKDPSKLSGRIRYGVDGEIIRMSEY